jgi:hypothetical protein
MVSDQNRFRTKQPSTEYLQPASEVLLQPNGDACPLGCFALRWQLLIKSLRSAMNRKEGFLDGKQRGKQNLLLDCQRTAR